MGAFEALAAQLVGVPEKVMEGTFIKGLKPELRATVRLLQPTGLSQAMKLAVMVDENKTSNIGDHGRSLENHTNSIRKWWSPTNNHSGYRWFTTSHGRYLTTFQTDDGF